MLLKEQKEYDHCLDIVKNLLQMYEHGDIGIDTWFNEARSALNMSYWRLCDVDMGESNWDRYKKAINKQIN
jgi:hypothetical protein